MKATLMVEITNNLKRAIGDRLSQIYETYYLMDKLNHKRRMLASDVDNDCKLLEAIMDEPDCHENFNEKTIQDTRVMLESARNTIQSCFGNDCADVEFRLNNALRDLEKLYEKALSDDYKTAKAIAAQQSCLDAMEAICAVLDCLRKDTND
jgi:hypothetical protein